MNPKKIPSLLIAAAAFATASSVAFAQQTVIHNGESYGYAGFNHDIGSVDTSTFSTGSASLLLNYTAQQNVVINSTASMALGDINWATDSISFDYKTSSMSAFYRIRLYAWNGAANILLVDHIYASPGLVMTTDNTWHSVTLTGSDWTAAYHTAIGNGTLNTTTPYLLRVGFQNLSPTHIGTINIDNISIGSPIPEPSSFALLASAGAGLMVVTRRRRRA